MVCRAEEAMKKREKIKKCKEDDLQKKKMQYSITNCNKDKSSKFKRSTSNLDNDGASSAIFLLACIACSSFSYHL
ncbi:hypothetical protein V5N11_009989 [Cardamine amara subsp. amara]|uniref:Transmembrane protein n=1 Tax=Cardamine amara subsp. amara TaxID=228776 RepID=A0ABD1AKN2_CARAN